MWADTDATFSRFFEECVNAPDLCALASRGSNATDLEALIYDKLEEFKFRPVPFGGGVLNANFLRSFIRPALYRPGRWPLLAAALDGVLSGNYLEAIEYVGAILADAGAAHNGGVETDSPYGINCVDKDVHLDGGLDELLPQFHRQWEESRSLGDFTAFLGASCAQWKIEPKERYEGSFLDIKTRNPLLIIGNTFDPATSIRSAFNMSSGFVDSVVLTQDGYGVRAFAHFCVLRRVSTFPCVVEFVCPLANDYS